MNTYITDSIPTRHSYLSQSTIPKMSFYFLDFFSRQDGSFLTCLGSCMTGESADGDQPVEFKNPYSCCNIDVKDIEDDAAYTPSYDMGPFETPKKDDEDFSVDEEEFFDEADFQRMVKEEESRGKEKESAAEPPPLSPKEISG